MQISTLTLVRNPLPCRWSSRVEKRKLLDPVGALKEKFLRPSPPLFHPQVHFMHVCVYVLSLGKYLLKIQLERIHDTFTWNKITVELTGDTSARYLLQAEYSQMLSAIIFNLCIMWKGLTAASHAASARIDRAPCTIIPECWCYFLKGSVWFLPLFTKWRLCTSSLLPFSEDTVCYCRPFDNQSHCLSVPRPFLPLQYLDYTQW